MKLSLGAYSEHLRGGIPPSRSPAARKRYRTRKSFRFDVQLVDSTATRERTKLQTPNRLHPSFFENAGSTARASPCTGPALRAPSRAHVLSALRTPRVHNGATCCPQLRATPSREGVDRPPRRRTIWAIPCKKCTFRTVCVLFGTKCTYLGRLRKITVFPKAP